MPWARPVTKTLISTKSNSVILRSVGHGSLFDQLAYHVSFKEKLLDWETQGKKLDEEEETFFEEVERM